MENLTNKTVTTYVPGSQKRTYPSRDSNMTITLSDTDVSLLLKVVDKNIELLKTTTDTLRLVDGRTPAVKSLVSIRCQYSSIRERLSQEAM